MRDHAKNEILFGAYSARDRNRKPKKVQEKPRFLRMHSYTHTFYHIKRILSMEFSEIYKARIFIFPFAVILRHEKGRFQRFKKFKLFSKKLLTNHFFYDIVLPVPIEW